jgi:hypothetical protein
LVGQHVAQWAELRVRYPSLLWQNIQSSCVPWLSEDVLSRRSATTRVVRSELRKISPKTITMPRSFLIKKAGSTTNYSHCPLKKRPVHIIKDTGLSTFLNFFTFF